MHELEHQQLPVVTPAEFATQARRRDSKPAGGDGQSLEFTPDAAFFQAQLEAMQRELDRGIARRFELLEKSLGVPVGTSRPGSSSPKPVLRWLRRAQLPILYSVLALLLGYLAWQTIGWPWAPAGSAPATQSPATGAGEASEAAASPDATGASAASARDSQTSEVGASGGQSAEPPAQGSQDPPKGKAGGGGSLPAYRDDWHQTWKAFAAEKPFALADWLLKLSNREGLDESQVTRGQQARARGFSETLQQGQALDSNDLSLARQILFEYVIALWTRERQLSDTVTIDLDRRDVTSELIDKLLVDLDPSPRPQALSISSPELQAAVINTWIERQAGGLR